MHTASGHKDRARGIHRPSPPDIIRLLKRALISCRILQSRLPLRGIKKL